MEKFDPQNFLIVYKASGRYVISIVDKSTWKQEKPIFALNDVTALAAVGSKLPQLKEEQKN